MVLSPCRDSISREPSVWRSVLRSEGSDYRPANSHGFTVSLTISGQSHDLTATQANLMGSSLRRVNIYK